MTQPTPAQSLAALQNHHRPCRTHGAKVRDALQHVRQSQNEKTGWRAGSLDIGQMTSRVVTRE
jgi:hypothetical protein